MTYEIVEALQQRNSHDTVRGLDYAAREEACALIDGGTRWGTYSTARHQRLRIPNDPATEAAKEFYAEDITDQLNNPVQLTPQRLMHNRRFAVAWAVAEVLRTNNDITEGGKKTV